MTPYHEQIDAQISKLFETAQPRSKGLRRMDSIRLQIIELRTLYRLMMAEENKAKKSFWQRIKEWLKK